MPATRKRKSPDISPTDSDDITVYPQSRKKRKICHPIEYSNSSNTNNRNTNTSRKHLLPTNYSAPNSSSSTIQFDVRSWGWKDPSPYKSYIKVTNNETESKGLKTFDLNKRRGHRIVVIDGISGNIEQSIAFDTWADIYAGIRLRIFLQTLQFKPNKWVIIITHDSGYNINTEAAWEELERWGVMKDNHPKHRESYILILSTNRKHNWWQHIVDPQHYFEKKYDQTIDSCNKKKSKKHKKKNKKHKISVNKTASIITESQLNILKSYGANVLFQRRVESGKGAMFFKGFLPKMVAIDVEDERVYTRQSPVQLALQNGIKPCDTETQQFYCVSCLDNSDAQHLLICYDDMHFDDDNARNVMPKEVKMREQMENAEIDPKFRVRSCGQAFHIYCVTYPDQMWIRWCGFMGLKLDDASQTPGFVELNIKKQQTIWNVRKFGNKHGQEVDEKEVNTKHREVMNTGNFDFYVDDYAEDYRLTSSIHDLSQWFCHWHRRGHRIFCRCGKPMVEQLCRDANGETECDLNDGFKGLYCNNYDRGCTKLIKPNESLFRCMSGARCKETHDGMDYCMKCVVHDISKHEANIRCLCGARLILGNVFDVCGIFKDEKCINVKDGRHSRIKKANTYRCAWCLKKFDNKSEDVFYCLQQSDACQRIIRNHFLQYQPFVVCIGCGVQSTWMNETCVCGSNLHCRLLADWIHHDVSAYHNNILDMSMAATLPNGNAGKMDASKRIQLDNDETPYDFYIKRREADDEHLYFRSFNIKYVLCTLCGVMIRWHQFVFICNNECHSRGESSPSNECFYLCAKCGIKQRKRESLFPASMANCAIQICLLFVAHDGVSQSQLWQQWLNEDAQIRSSLGVAVQCNNFFALKTGKMFAEKYRIDVQRATSWGKLLVPLAIQKSLQISLTKYPNCRRFYIISGREIPLVSASHLYLMPNKSQIMAKRITAQTATKLSKKRMGKLLQWYSHHAAMCLQRSHAEMLSVAPWKEYFDDSDHIYDHVGAPDEFLFGTTLNAFGVDMKNEIWREVTTDFELPTKSDVRHPINWKSLDERHTFWKINETMHIEGKEKKTLREYIENSYKKPHKLWGYGPCFFRKIAQNVEFKQFIPWKLCNIKPPIIDKKVNIDETLIYRKELNSQAYMDQDEVIENENENDHNL